MRWLPLAALAACSDYDVTRSTKSDIFAQADVSGGVDILWVMDNSGTMYEEQAILTANAEAFIAVLAASSVDYRLGVVSTDYAHEDGALLGDVLSTDSEDLVGGFVDAVESAGFDGDRREQGFAAAVAAVDPEGENDDFARDDAPLEVVVYSDEDDQSNGDVGEWIDALEGHRDNEDIGINAVMGDLPDGCFSSAAAADPGTRYAEAVTATEGMSASICSPEMDAVLARLALRALGLQDTFTLSAIPMVATMVVKVDGAEVWQRDRHGWRYDASNNTVVFDGYAVPPPKAAIEISYFDWVNGAEE